MDAIRAAQRPQSSFTDIAGNFVCAGCAAFNMTNINNTAYSAPGNSDKILQAVWVGARYSVTEQVDVVGAYYHYNQNNFALSTANVAAGNVADTKKNFCQGTMDAVSFLIDWKFAAWFDAYAGFMYSQFNGGFLANGTPPEQHRSDGRPSVQILTTPPRGRDSAKIATAVLPGPVSFPAAPRRCAACQRCRQCSCDPSAGALFARGTAGSGNLHPPQKATILPTGECHPQAAVSFASAPRMVGAQSVRTSSLSVVGVHPSRAGAEFGHRHGRCRKGGLPRLCAVLISIAVCGGLAGCAVGPDYQPPEPPMPQTFAAAPLAKGDGRAVDPAGRWWCALHDGELNSLIERAIAASPTLEIALDRLQQARAQEAVLIGAALPSLEASAGGGWGTGSDLARGRASAPLVSAENGVGVSQIANIVGFEPDGRSKIPASSAARSKRRGQTCRRRLPPATWCWFRSSPTLRAPISTCARCRCSSRWCARTSRSPSRWMTLVQERFDRGITNELDVTLARRELARLQAQVAPLAAQIDAARQLRHRHPDRRVSGKCRQGAGATGHAAGASRPHPARFADRSPAPAARHCRSRAAIGRS